MQDQPQLVPEAELHRQPVLHVPLPDHEDRQNRTQRHQSNSGGSRVSFFVKSQELIRTSYKRVQVSAFYI